jgi:hypothetical protein
VRGNVGTEYGINLVFDRFQIAGVWHARQAQGQGRIQHPKTRQHQGAQTAQFPSASRAPATLVLHNTSQIEKIHHRRVRVNFDLKAALRARGHCSAMSEAQGREPATE